MAIATTGRIPLTGDLLRAARALGQLRYPHGQWAGRFARDMARMADASDDSPSAPAITITPRQEFWIWQTISTYQRQVYQMREFAELVGRSVQYLAEHPVIMPRDDDNESRIKTFEELQRNRFYEGPVTEAMRRLVAAACTDSNAILALGDHLEELGEADWADRVRAWHDCVTCITEKAREMLSRMRLEFKAAVDPLCIVAQWQGWQMRASFKTNLEKYGVRSCTIKIETPSPALYLVIDHPADSGQRSRLRIAREFLDWRMGE